MASRSDQLDSHQFTLQRAVGALAMRDPDPVSSPMRRIGGALFASVMFGVLAVAAVGVYGVLRPGGGTSWKDGKATIIEKETGARYVYRDSLLYPVLNFSSAVLIVGSTSTVTVSRSALEGVPRGTPVGIEGAPDALPSSGQLIGDPWTLCSRPAKNTVESVLRVGGAPIGTSTQDDGVLVADPSGGLHMLWHGRRYGLPSGTARVVVLSGLGWQETDSVRLPAAVLNAIPAGPELGPVQGPRSNAVSILPGLTVGQVFVVNNVNGTKTYGVALADTIADVTEVQAAILVADNGKRIVELSPADVNKVTAAHQKWSPTADDAPPADLPKQIKQAAAVCVRFSNAKDAPVLTTATADAVAKTSGEVEAPHSTNTSAVSVDWIVVPAGRGVLVRSVASPGAADGAIALVSDLGLRFAVPSAQVQGTLGYGNVTPVALPSALVSLVPVGRALDPNAAWVPTSVS